MVIQNNKLDKDVKITTDNIFDSLTYDLDTDSWMFHFKNKISLMAATIWRLLKDNRIILVSADHKEQFGLPKPVDIVKELSDLLRGQKLTNIKIRKYTADLNLTLTGNFEIEVFISSGGYESYDLLVENKRYIGMGMGDIAIFNIGEQLKQKETLDSNNTFTDSER